MYSASTMPFLTDLMNSGDERPMEQYSTSLLSPQSIDCIELSPLGGTATVGEDEANVFQLRTTKPRSRLLAVGASLGVAVILLGGLSATSNRDRTPMYHPLATKPVFLKPNNTDQEEQTSNFLPPYTLKLVVTNPYSPQAKALKWVESYPQFRVFPKWRRRQLMALATFYYSTGGGYSWNDDASKDWLSKARHECNWQGDDLFNPQCGKKARYSRLELGFNNLKGTLPPELAMLPSLTYLELYGNDHLVGSIPSVWGQLTALTDLSLYSNALNGPLPSQLGSLSKLGVLNLDHNRFTGVLPTQLGLMTLLTRLHLADNLMTGSIPSVLQQLSNLQSLFLQGNRFNGTVSPSMCYLSDLREIWVDCETVKCPCQQCLCAHQHFDVEMDEKEQAPDQSKSSHPEAGGGR